MDRRLRRRPAAADDDVLHANAQWGVRLSARKHKRMLEGLAANAELEASGSTKREKSAKKPPKPGPKRLLRTVPSKLQRTLSRDFR